MAKPRVTGPCRLCGTVGELQASHIIPKWAYRMIAHRQGDLPPIRIGGGVARYDGRQPTDHLLDSACEQLLGTRERYASEVSARRENSFPAFEAATVLQDDDDGTSLAELGPNLDVEALSYFAASVIWRASVSSLFPDTQLGPYEERFAAYLRGREPWPSQAAVILTLAKPAPPDTSGLIIAPESHRLDARIRRHFFVACGMTFQLLVGAHIPHGLARFSIANRKALLADGREILGVLDATARAAKITGKLADRYPLRVRR